ncbi:glycoside hydrolase family 16 protein [Hortaea werneckii]|nr:glycoside hydrolase family 16 protein [Hortaea werneckii]KAI7097836.1 glycoside hydrolase family 16 protein [Hortaea werneckii]KAI7237052.1 glycoside hydrolase family 16 protein [Hortaea werneckii]KAI7311253.1 glycoside hydrolase family 16 protein [Hortaea werneckii]KAI7380204.1 glycoside hydrolase family 16 protein [Hortaea werneckii]
MRSLRLDVQKNVIAVLSLLCTTHAQSVAEGTFYKGGGAPGAAPYQLVDDYHPSIFFSKFNFYSSYDPTYGHVKYVTKDVAWQNGYVQEGDQAIMSVDTTNKWPRGGDGRPATRIISNNAYTHGLFILDLEHMPWGCGTWPAYWLLGPEWATNGEIDIIEGVNTGMSNSISMHTEAGCTIAGSGQTATFQTSNCDHNANGNSGCGSLLDSSKIPNNYGEGLNNNGGGVYATEWTSEYIKHWFFPRGSIPDNIASGEPDPATWGIPTVNAQGSCDIDSHFNNMSIIINTDFCGAWAGWVYQSQFPECPQNMSANSLDSCVDFVGNNPSYFEQAYWEINSLQVYQMPEGAQPSASYTTSLSSVTPAASTAGTSQLPVGPGASTQDVSSAPYTGPTSSGTPTGSAPASASTPVLCPDYNGTAFTDSNNVQYEIHCGFDYQGGGNVYAAESFENCLGICDNTSGCKAVSFVGGNGAGSCYVKDATGSLNYDGSTNAAVRISGSGSATSSVQQTLITSEANTASATSMMTDSPSQSLTAYPSSTSSSTPNAACPDADGEELMDDNGKSYTIYCSSDTTGDGAFETRTFESGTFTQCMDACDEFSECGAWVWSSYPDYGGICYFKALPQAPKPVTDDNFVAGIAVGGTASATSTATNVPRSLSSTAPLNTLTPPSYESLSLTSSSDSSGMTTNLASSSVALMSSTASSNTGSSSMTSSNIRPSDMTSSNTRSSGSVVSSSSSSTMLSNPTMSTSSVASDAETPESYDSATPSTSASVSGNVSPSSYLASTSTRTSASGLPTSSAVTAGTQPSSYATRSSNSASTPSLATEAASSASIFSSTPPAVSMASSRTSSVPPSSSIASSQPPTVSTTTSTQFTPGPYATPTFTEPPPDEPAPSCPADPAESCEDAGDQSVCSSDNGAAYGLTCNVAYTGTVLSPPSYRIRRQSEEPSFQACANLCDTTTGCVAFNYIGTQCTMFSEVTGTYYAPGAVGASQVTLPTNPTVGLPPAYTSTIGASQSSNAQSPSTSTSSTSPLSQSSVTAPGSTTVLPTTSNPSASASGSSTLTTIGSSSVYTAASSTGAFSSSPGSVVTVFTSGSPTGTCKPTPGVGTTTLTTTTIVTSCGVPLTCAAP